MTTTKPHPADLRMHAIRGDKTVLAVHVDDASVGRTTRRLARGLAAASVPGMRDVTTDGDRMVVAFDPTTLTRSHLELWIHTVAGRV